MIHDNRVYANENEKFVKTVLVHANASNELFHDEATKNPVLEAELKDLFLKGMVIVQNSKFYNPVHLDGTSIVSYDGSAAVTFTLNSAE